MIITFIIIIIIIIIILKQKHLPSHHGFPSGIIRQNWNDTEKISMAPAQG